MLEGACFRPQHCKRKICAWMLSVREVDLVVCPAMLAHQGGSPSDKSSERNWTRVRMMRRQREGEVTSWLHPDPDVSFKTWVILECARCMHVAHLGIVPRKWFKENKKDFTWNCHCVFDYIFILLHVQPTWGCFESKWCKNTYLVGWGWRILKILKRKALKKVPFLEDYQVY